METNSSSDLPEPLLEEFFSCPDIRRDFSEFLKSRTREELTMAATHKAKKQRRTRIFFGTGVAVMLFITLGVVASISLNAQSGFAFENVVEHLRKVSTMSFTEVTTAPGVTCRVKLLAPNLRRNENEDKSVHIIDVHKGKMLTLGPINNDKSARFTRLLDIEPRPDANVVEDLLQLVKSTKSLEGKDGISVVSAKSINDELVDGKKAQGFLIEFDHEEYESSVEMTVWADKQTMLPVKITSIWKHNGSDTTMNVTMTDFDYAEIPREQFELKVPDGYSLQHDASKK